VSAANDEDRSEPPESSDRGRSKSSVSHSALPAVERLST
jgi:hypothetical protein